MPTMLEHFTTLGGDLVAPGCGDARSYLGTVVAQICDRLLNEEISRRSQVWLTYDDAAGTLLVSGLTIWPAAAPNKKPPDLLQLTLAILHDHSDTVRLAIVQDFGRIGRIQETVATIDKADSDALTEQHLTLLTTIVRERLNQGVRPGAALRTFGYS